MEEEGEFSQSLFIQNQRLLLLYWNKLDPDEDVQTEVYNIICNNMY